MRASAFFLFAALAACNRRRVAPGPAIDAAAENKLFHDDAAAALDPSVAPCADFYAYACGGWMRATTIPPDEGMWTRSFQEIGRRNDETLRAILERDATHPPADEPASEQLGSYYATCVDETAIDARGNGELVRLLEGIDTTDAEHAAASVAWLHTIGVPALFVLEPEKDLRDSQHLSAVLRQPPLTLPESSYADAKTREVLVATLTKMFALFGDSPERAHTEATSVIALERALADRFESHAVFHDASAAPVVVDGKGLTRIAPDFPWKSYFATLGISVPAALHVATPHYLTAMTASFAVTLRSVTGRDQLRSLLRWNLIHALAPTSSSELAAEDFRISQLRSGATENAPRWKRCVRAIETNLGGPLGSAFDHAQSDDLKIANARSMTASLEDAMRDEIRALPWLDDPTRARALQKIERLHVDIAPKPNLPGDFLQLAIGRESASLDGIRARQFQAFNKLHAIGTDAPPTWNISAGRPNAYFDPRSNALVVLLGILEPPIFSLRDAAGYGAFGSVIGHELSHAIDGRFDENGNLATWWSDATIAAHRDRSACVRGASRASSTDELMADQGGLKVAYRALARDLPVPSEKQKARDQAFFTGFAQLWCAKVRPEALADFEATNAHALPSDRVNRSVSQLPEFAAAFSCAPGDAMAPIDRCNAW